MCAGLCWVCCEAKSRGFGWWGLWTGMRASRAVAVFSCSHCSLKDVKIFGVYMKTSKANLTDPESRVWGVVPCSPLARRPWRLSLGCWAMGAPDSSLHGPFPADSLYASLVSFLPTVCVSSSGCFRGCTGLLCSDHHAQSWQESLSQHSAGPRTLAGLILSISLLPLQDLEAWASCLGRNY